MAGQTVKWFLILGIFAFCLLLGDARPGLARAGAPAAGPGKHVIKAGETINLLALRYGVPAAAILKANPGLDPTRLQLGKAIVIPQGAPAATATPEAAPAQAGKSIELRPEKAPQATQPLTAAPPARELADTPAKPAVAQPQPPEREPAGGGQPVAGAPRAPEAPAKRPMAEEVGPTPAPPVAATVAKDRTPPRPAGPNLSGTGLWLAGLAGLLALFVVLAMRDILANIGAGLALLVYRSPRPGDVVRVADSVGRVVSRGPLSMVVRTRDNERVIVPNAKVVREVLVVLPPRDEE
jgi:hypothetical protein